MRGGIPGVDEEAYFSSYLDSPGVRGPKNIYKFMTLLPKDYCLIPGNGAINLFGLDQDDIYTNLKRYHQRIII